MTENFAEEDAKLIRRMLALLPPIGAIIQFKHIPRLQDTEIHNHYTLPRQADEKATLSGASDHSRMFGLVVGHVVLNHGVYPERLKPLHSLLNPMKAMSTRYFQEGLALTPEAVTVGVVVNNAGWWHPLSDVPRTRDRSFVLAGSNLAVDHKVIERSYYYLDPRRPGEEPAFHDFSPAIEKISDLDKQRTELLKRHGKSEWGDKVRDFPHYDIDATMAVFDAEDRPIEGPATVDPDFWD